jgi:SAM-dependent methyltransferase
MQNYLVSIGHKLLSIPICYDAFQAAVGSVRFRKKYVNENLKSFKAENILDLGCGTASTAELLPESSLYVGIDTSEKYLEKAKNRTKNLNASLINEDIANGGWVRNFRMDSPTLAFALGIYHHLDDRRFADTVSNLSKALSPGSRVVSLDPVIDENTTKLASWFARNDRGKFLRKSGDYLELFSKNGFSIDYEITRKSFHIPYDLILISATRKG